MTLHDVNVLVYAFRSDSPYFQQARAALESSRASGESVLFSPTVAASFVRIVTNVRIFREPASASEAWSFLDIYQDHPAVRFTDIDEMTYGIFRHLALTGGENGNAVPDAMLAALAIRYDAVFVTADTGFRRYPGLKLQLL
ncbi:MAG: PIN domain-containing protein [Spirochaetaceae bacterium]|nr:MAG: PIN domain-containing protein [Spirochaetaceae bacterium]